MSPRTLVSALLLSAALISAGCGQRARPVAPTSFDGPPGLALVPADTPYVLALLKDPPEQLRKSMMRGGTTQKQLPGSSTLDPSATPLYMRLLTAFVEVASEMENATPSRSLGSGRFVLYGLGVWPVMRVEIKDSALAREALATVLTRAQVTYQARTEGGIDYALVHDGPSAVVMAVLDRELVIAVVPDAELGAKLPLILGLRAPERSLAAAGTLTELIARHGFQPSMVGFVDGGAIAAAALPLLVPSEACSTDRARLAAMAPRIALGTRASTDTSFHMAIVFEAPALGRALAATNHPVPGVELALPPGAIGLLGMAVDPEQLQVVLRDLAAGPLQARFTCPELAGLNEFTDSLAQLAGRPIPPPLRGLHGFAIEVDEIGEHGGSGAASLFIRDPMPLISMALPPLLGLQVTVVPGGAPVELPLGELSAEFGPAFLAVGGDRAVLTVGPDALARMPGFLDAHAPASSPLFVFAFDMGKLGELLRRFGGEMTDRDPGTFVFGLTASDEGVAIELAGTWPAGSR